jgi:hypothetical protein
MTEIREIYLEIINQTFEFTEHVNIKLLKRQTEASGFVWDEPMMIECLDYCCTGSEAIVRRVTVGPDTAWTTSPRCFR